MKQDLAAWDAYQWPKVCECIANGAKVSEICRDHVLYIGLFLSWINADPDRALQYRQALEAGVAYRKARTAEKRQAERELKKRAREILAERKRLIEI